MLYKMTELKYEPDPRLERALDVLFILHADHEQNCSTSAVRAVGSSQVDPYSAVAAGVAALYGPLHGGANEAVLRMLRRIGTVENIPDFIKGVKDGNERLMGFGHRVYKNYDPRAKIIKKACDDVFEVTGKNPLLEIALELEKIALEDDYFVKRKLYPNVDFYSGLIYEALGLPVEMFPVLFAIRRTSGWIAQWLEMVERHRAEDRPPAADLHRRPRARLRADRRARLRRRVCRPAHSRGHRAPTLGVCSSSTCETAPASASGRFGRATRRAALSRARAPLAGERPASAFSRPSRASPLAELRYLTEVDHVDHWAEVAVLKHDPEAIVGVARWIRDEDDPQAAEAAIVIGDALQGQGLGRRLGLSIADAARLCEDRAPVHRDDAVRQRRRAAPLRRDLRAPRGRARRRHGRDRRHARSLTAGASTRGRKFRTSVHVY